MNWTHTIQGSTFREKNGGQLAPKFSDLVARKSISQKVWNVSHQWKKFGGIGNPSGRNVEFWNVHKNSHKSMFTLLYEYTKWKCILSN